MHVLLLAISAYIDYFNSIFAQSKLLNLKYS
nr:MAG TPA: hypothetical protein [Caudoviricetes sp.]